MEKEYVIQIAQTIQEQLIGLTPMPVLMSWDIAEFAATIFKGLPALRIKVNGLTKRNTKKLPSATHPIIKQVTLLINQKKRLVSSKPPVRLY